MKPAIFNTITGADWARNIPDARKRRSEQPARILSQLHTFAAGKPVPAQANRQAETPLAAPHSSGTSPETRRPSNAPRERCERSAG
jgi:hypothetical protein